MHDHVAEPTEQADSVAQVLVHRLMAGARQRTIQQSVAGARFCAVLLDDGGAGVANLCSDVCGQPSRQGSAKLPQPGAPAADALACLSSPSRSALGLATANALANRLTHGSHALAQANSNYAGALIAESLPGDLLDVLELRHTDDVGMIGCFDPLVEPIRRRVRTLFICERPPRLRPGLFSEDRAAELLARCSVALITATTLISGTIDALLIAAAGCREVVLLGPSTPLVPEIFARAPGRVTLLAGIVVTDPEALLRTVAQGGSTRDLKATVTKMNVRVPTASHGPPSR